MTLSEYQKLQKDVSGRSGRSRLYRIWDNMLGRCYRRSKGKIYERYGGRGIEVCDEWRKDYLAFAAYSLEKGYDDSLEIDRSRVTASMREIITSLQEQGIQTRAIWGLINEQKPYEKEETYKLEKAPYYAARILNIPSSTQITPEEITYVADKVKQLLRSLANG